LFEFYKSQKGQKNNWQKEEMDSNRPKKKGHSKCHNYYDDSKRPTVSYRHDSTIKMERLAATSVFLETIPSCKKPLISRTFLRLVITQI